MTTPTTPSIPLVSNNKQLAASICAILIAVVSLLGAYGVITPQQTTATETMIRQLMQDMNLTYAQVTNALNVEVGSSLYGLAGPYSYLIEHPLGDNAVTGMKNGTTGAWDYWSLNSNIVMQYAAGNLSASTPQGGLIFVRSGSFNGAGNVNITGSDVDFVGEDRDTTILQGFTLNFTGNSNVVQNIYFNWTLSGVLFSPLTGTTLYNQVLNCGFNNNTQALTFYNSSRFDAENNFFYDCPTGIDIRDYGSDSTIQNNKFGYAFGSATAAQSLYNVKIENGNVHISEGIVINNNIFDTVGYGIWTNITNFMQITKNLFEPNGTYPSVYVSTGSTTTQLHVADNIFDGSLDKNTSAIVIGSATNVWITGNTIYNQDFDGIQFNATASPTYAANVNIWDNSFYGNSRTHPSTYYDIYLDSVQNVSEIGNDFKSTGVANAICENNTSGSQPSGICHANNFQSAKPQLFYSTNVIYSDNLGYNILFNGAPGLGYIANPVDGTIGLFLIDSGGASAIANNTVYYCKGSAKDIYINGGAFSGATRNCTINGQVVFANLATGPTMMLRLEAGSSIVFSWTSAPTIKVYGE